MSEFWPLIAVVAVAVLVLAATWRRR